MSRRLRFYDVSDNALKIEKIITKQKKNLIREKPILQHLSVQRELLLPGSSKRTQLVHQIIQRASI